VIDGRVQDDSHGSVQAVPLLAFQPMAARGGVDAGGVEHFRGVEIADAGDCSLVQEGDLDRAAAGVESLAQLLRRDCQRVGAERAAFAAQSIGELGGGEEADGAQAAAVPEQQLAVWAAEA